MITVLQFYLTHSEKLHSESTGNRRSSLLGAYMLFRFFRLRFVARYAFVPAIDSLRKFLSCVARLTVQKRKHCSVVRMLVKVLVYTLASTMHVRECCERT